MISKVIIKRQLYFFHSGRIGVEEEETIKKGGKRKKKKRERENNESNVGKWKRNEAGKREK